MTFWLLITGISGLGYAMLIIFFSRGWRKLNSFVPDKTTTQYTTKFSIIIPYKNEADNLPLLTARLNNQTYPPHLFEILFINDHSTDEGPSIIDSFCDQNHSVSHLQLNNRHAGKKEALCKGIKNAKHSTLISLDADVMPGEKWLSTIAAYWEAHHPDAIIAPVYMKPGHKALHIFETLDMISLVASGAGSAGIGRPVLCNGANFIFTKDDYRSSDNLREKTPSGDDIFLLLHLKKQKNKKIHFLKSMDAAVSAFPQSTVKAFIKQRIRWGSKSRYYKDPDIIFTTFTVFIFNGILTILLPAALFMPQLFSLWASLFIFKLIIDSFLLIPAIRFFKLSKYMLFFFPAAFIYPFYLFLTGIASQIVNYSWKKEAKNQG